MIEFIPEKYQKKDLVPGATFVHFGGGDHVVFLEHSMETYDQGRGVHEKVPGTGCRVQFRGGHLLIENKKLLALLLASGNYQSGAITIDREDPTGFWRHQGAIKTEKVSVVKPAGIKRPTSINDMDLTKSNLDAIDPKVAPLSRAI